MEFMLILLADRDAPDDPSIRPEMIRFSRELAGAGQLRGGAPLYPEMEGARVTGEVLTLGPFPSRVVVGGYFLIDCQSRPEAIEIARRCPHTRVGTVEVRQIVPMRPPRPSRPRKKSPAKKAPRKIKAKKSPARRKKR